MEQLAGRSYFSPDTSSPSSWSCQLLTFHQLRKIKCDAGVDGCEPCRLANATCETEDRISGATLKRGHATQLEQELSLSRDYIQELKAQLEKNGIAPLQAPGEPSTPDFARTRRTSSDSLDDNDGNWKRPRLEAFRKDAIGENCLGNYGNEYLSLAQGSRMTLFDHRFDFTHFVPPARENRAYELSEDEYHDYISGARVARQPQFQPEEDVYNLTQLFFGGVAFFTPIVDRRKFYAMLARKYKENKKLSEHDTIIFNMVMSIAGFQYAVRMPDVAAAYRARDLAKDQLLYCLAQVPNLLRSTETQDIQALALMCMAMRALQRPGPAWEFCDMVLGRAIALGLHLSLDSWPDDGKHKDEYQVSMRQRIFWSILVCYVNISGNLGRPMRIRAEDIDIEIPKAVPDYIYDIDEAKHHTDCSWFAAGYGFELTLIMLQVYSAIGALRSSQSMCGTNFNRISAMLDDLERNLPPRLSGRPQEVHRMVDIIAAYYLRLAILNTRLLIHHPRHLSASKWEWSEENLTTLHCTSGDMLEIAERLKEAQSLDTTLYYNMNFMYAIFVDLFVHRYRAWRSKPVDITQLRQDMDRWIAVMQAVGQMLGSGGQLASSLKSVVDRCIAQIGRLLERQAGVQSSEMAIASSPRRRGQFSQPTSEIEAQATPEDDGSAAEMSQAYSTYEAAPVTADLTRSSVMVPPFRGTGEHEGHNASATLCPVSYALPEYRLNDAMMHHQHIQPYPPQMLPSGELQLHDYMHDPTITLGASLSARDGSSATFPIHPWNSFMDGTMVQPAGISTVTNSMSVPLTMQQAISPDRERLETNMPHAWYEHNEGS